jgi:hypothetical protein
MGKRDHGKTIVRLSRENKSSAQITARELPPIGWHTASFRTAESNRAKKRCD